MPQPSKMKFDILQKNGKPQTAAAIQADCSHSSKYDYLLSILDTLLDPLEDIDNEEAIDWYRWLMAGGLTPEEFSSTVRRYDKATTCGLVWPANFVAYRCRTCGIPPCMSLCADCFQAGNHEGHDFIMFRSETGGACDCGETNVVKESGCCSMHLPHRSIEDTEIPGQSPMQNKNKLNEGSSSAEQTAPPELLCVSNAMMPRLMLRLIQHMRLQTDNVVLSSASKFINFLKGLTEMGAPMRQVLTHTLTNPQVYKSLTESEESLGRTHKKGTDMASNLGKVLKSNYAKALREMTMPDPPQEYQDIPSLQRRLEHKTFLEELVFWTIKFGFPEDIVWLLLRLRADITYKEAFIQTFIRHYGFISHFLLRSSDPDVFCNRAVTVSVQFFSIEELTLRMVDQMKLLHVVLISLTQMMQGIAEPDPSSDFLLINCGHNIMKDNYYWPLKSDLNEILSHGPVALRFLEQDDLLRIWFQLLSMFQGMNPSKRRSKNEAHVEYENDNYVHAITAELQISAMTMWALLSHVRDKNTSRLTMNLLTHCWDLLRKWSFQNASTMYSNNQEPNAISFHLPLHRHFAMFVHQGVWKQGITLSEVLPPEDDLGVAIQPLLNLQVAYYEILSGLWIRNGGKMKLQAMEYVSSLCCNSTVDTDLFMLQISTARIPRNDFMLKVIRSFKLRDSLLLFQSCEPNPYFSLAEEMQMLENFLIFLATIVSVRTNLGVSEEDLLRKEMSTLLCKGDKTHSQLMELMPERCGSGSVMKNFESVLSQVADYKAPKSEISGNMSQGIFIPKSDVWSSLFDPVHVLLRSDIRGDYETALQRFYDFAKKEKIWNGSGNLWPPFYADHNEKLSDVLVDPRNILQSRVFHAVVYLLLHKAVNQESGIPPPSDNIIALIIFLFEISLYLEETKDCRAPKQDDFGLSMFYSSDNIWRNVSTSISVGGGDGNQTQSILSLLLQLFHKLGGSLNTVLTSTEEAKSKLEDRVGDGSFFISKVLKKLVSNYAVRQNVEELQLQLWPSPENMQDKAAIEKEEIRRKVKERKLKLMADMAQKRQHFMATTSELSFDHDASEHVGEPIVDSEMESIKTEVQYECLYCLRTGPNTLENPIGLVVFLNVSSHLRHRRESRDTKTSNLNKYEENLSDRWESMRKHFDDSVLSLTLPGNNQGGILLQTCGHHLHLDCFSRYLDPSSSDQRLQTSSTAFALGKDEYTCPLCRKLANMLLPIVPDCDLLLSPSKETTSDLTTEITQLLRRRHCPTKSSKLQQSIQNFLEELRRMCTQYNLTPEKFSFKDAGSGSGTIASFLCNVLYYNICLDINLFQADHQFESATTPRKFKGTSQRTSLKPLFHTLQSSYRALSAGHGRKLAQTWEVILGTRKWNANHREVPILMRDTSTLILHFAMQLPVKTSWSAFRVIAQALYQIALVQCLCGLGLRHGLAILRSFNWVSFENFSQMPVLVETILASLQSSPAFEEGNFLDTHQNTISIPKDMQDSLLIYLRTVAHLQHFLYDKDIPEFSSNEEEFGRFMNVCGLLDTGSNNFNVSTQTVTSWCAELSSFCSRSAEAAEMATKELQTVNTAWDIPRLIDLPKNYEILFQMYTSQVCSTCNNVPKNPGLCLICGQLVCMTDNCCTRRGSPQDVSEVVRHALDCGLGTCVFLSVLSSSVIVLREARACVWGSMFLDSHGEEDPGLKRGKPLILSEERYCLLQQLWFTSSFDHTAREWYWHNNSM